jgi:hypothetical protein
MILEAGSCAQGGCKHRHLSIRGSADATSGRIIKGCGGPYGPGREVPPSALHDVAQAIAKGLPVCSARDLARLRLEIEATVARMSAGGEVPLAEANDFLSEVFR